MRVTIITDKSSWMNTYSEMLASSLREEGASVNFVSSKEEIQNGDILFLLSCFQLIESDFLRKNRHNIVVHASVLP